MERTVAASILPAKVFDGHGSGSAYDVVEGIARAVDQGADVVDLSLGATSTSTAEWEAIQYARDHGVVIVGASGHAGATSLDDPARDEQTVAVGATRLDESATSCSNRGDGLDLVAPGGVTSVDQDAESRSEPGGAAAGSTSWAVGLGAPVGSTSWAVGLGAPVERRALLPRG